MQRKVEICLLMVYCYNFLEKSKNNKDIPYRTQKLRKLSNLSDSMIFVRMYNSVKINQK